MNRYWRSSAVVVLEAWRGKVKIDCYDILEVGFYFHDLANKNWWKAGANEYFFYDIRAGRCFEYQGKDVYVQRPSCKDGCIQVTSKWEWATMNMEILMTSLADSKVESSQTIQGLKAWGFDVSDLKLVRNYCGGLRLMRNNEDVLAKFVQATFRAEAEAAKA